MTQLLLCWPFSHSFHLSYHLTIAYFLIRLLGALLSLPSVCGLYLFLRKSSSAYVTHPLAARLLKLSGMLAITLVASWSVSPGEMSSDVKAFGYVSPKKLKRPIRCSIPHASIIIALNRKRDVWKKPSKGSKRTKFQRIKKIRRKKSSVCRRCFRQNLLLGVSLEAITNN